MKVGKGDLQVQFINPKTVYKPKDRPISSETDRACLLKVTAD